MIGEWPRVAGLLEKSLREGSFSLPDLARACITGAWSLWLFERDGEVVGAGVTEISDFPRMRKCLIRHMAGDAEILETHEATLVAYAAANRCDILEAYARKGLAKRLGWIERAVVIQKEI